MSSRIRAPDLPSAGAAVNQFLTGTLGVLRRIENFHNSLANGPHYPCYLLPARTVVPIAAVRRHKLGGLGLARRRRKGSIARTKSGRLSRAGSFDLVDRGPRENQAKRHALINGADPALAASASGILFAAGHLDQEQLNAGLRFARAHAIVFGRPWAHIQDPLRCLPWGGEPPSDELHAWAENRLSAWRAELTEEQIQAIGDLLVFNTLPHWWLCSRIKLREMPEDRVERQALISGLDILARVMGLRQRTGTIAAERSFSDVINEAAAVAEKKAEAAD
jgi:hypothetical protein